MIATGLMAFLISFRSSSLFCTIHSGGTAFSTCSSSISSALLRCSSTRSTLYSEPPSLSHRSSKRLTSAYLPADTQPKSLRYIARPRWNCATATLLSKLSALFKGMAPPLALLFSKDSAFFRFLPSGGDMFGSGVFVRCRRRTTDMAPRMLKNDSARLARSLHVYRWSK